MVVRSLFDAKRPGQLDLIGGGKKYRDCCDAGTGVRELKEEVGLRADHNKLNFVGIDMSPSGSTLVSCHYLYVPENYVADFDAGEVDEVVLLEPKQAMSELEHAGQRDMLQLALGQAGLRAA